MRLAALAKADSIPLPTGWWTDSRPDQHTPWMLFPQPGDLRILDPCCGAGDAISRLAHRLHQTNAIPWRPTGWSFTRSGPRRRHAACTAPSPQTCSALPRHRRLRRPAFKSTV